MSKGGEEDLESNTFTITPLVEDLVTTIEPEDKIEEEQEYSETATEIVAVDEVVEEQVSSDTIDNFEQPGGHEQIVETEQDGQQQQDEAHNVHLISVDIDSIITEINSFFFLDVNFATGCRRRGSPS